jgi:hypothetical protein
MDGTLANTRCTQRAKQLGLIISIAPLFDMLFTTRNKNSFRIFAISLKRCRYEKVTDRHTVVYKAGRE